MRRKWDTAHRARFHLRGAGRGAGSRWRLRGGAAAFCRLRGLRKPFGDGVTFGLPQPSEEGEHVILTPLCRWIDSGSEGGIPGLSSSHTVGHGWRSCVPNPLCSDFLCLSVTEASFQWFLAGATLAPRGCFRYLWGHFCLCQRMLAPPVSGGVDGKGPVKGRYPTREKAPSFTVAHRAL